MSIVNTVSSCPKVLLLGLTDHGDSRGGDSNVKIRKPDRKVSTLLVPAPQTKLGAQAGPLRVVALAALAGYFELHKSSYLLLSFTSSNPSKPPRSLLTLILSTFKSVQYDINTRLESNSDFEPKLLLLPCSTQ